MKYRSIFVSDIHLGTKFSQADKFLNFLKENESENLYLVGDIIDGWAIKRKFRWAQSHSDVIQKILKKARKGTKVYYITGNHDEFLRSFLPIFLGDNLTILNELDYDSIKGKRYYITHGDVFDSVTMTQKWLVHVGDIGYNMIMHLNPIFNFVRRKFGINKYWSLSKYVKNSVKSSINFITDFEEILVQHAKHKGYEGIICGHIHKAEIRDIDGITYLNSGDWVESCTALVETMDGEWKILDWIDKEI